MIRPLRLYLLSFALSVLIAACNQDPTSVGSNLIPDQDKISFKEFDSYQTTTFQKSSYYEQKIKLGSSPKLILGKNSFAESSVLFRFDLFPADSILNDFKAGKVNVSSASLKIKPTYSLGDKSQNFDFTVQQIKAAWTHIGFDRDSLNSFISGSLFDATDIKSSLVIQDTLITFNISKDVVANWLKSKYDTSVPVNNGVILKPKSTTNRFIGFESNLLDNGSTSLPILNVEFEKPNVYKKTITATASQDIHILTATLPAASSNIYLQGGYALRGYLFFDLSAFSKNLIISKATLELQLDESKSVVGTPQSDSLFVDMLADSTTKKLNGDSLVATYFTKKGNVYSADITWMVQKWVRNDPNLAGDRNHGVIISMYDEEFSAGRLSFYGSKETNAALRPRLKITYMQKP